MYVLVGNVISHNLTQNISIAHIVSLTVTGTINLTSHQTIDSEAKQYLKSMCMLVIQTCMC